jgi:hypothetical protein
MTPQITDPLAPNPAGATVVTGFNDLVHVQVEDFDLNGDNRLVRVLAIQPDAGGAAYRIPVDSAEAKVILDRHPDVEQALSNAPEPPEQGPVPAPVAAGPSQASYDALAADNAKTRALLEQLLAKLEDAGVKEPEDAPPGVVPGSPPE